MLLNIWIDTHAEATISLLKSHSILVSWRSGHHAFFIGQLIQSLPHQVWSNDLQKTQRSLHWLSCPDDGLQLPDLLTHGKQLKLSPQYERRVGCHLGGSRGWVSYSCHCQHLRIQAGTSAASGLRMPLHQYVALLVAPTSLEPLASVALTSPDLPLVPIGD